MLGYSFFGTVKSTNNVDFDKCIYSGYGTEFDTRGIFLFSNGSGFSKKVVTFGADMSSSGYVDNGKKDILVLGKVQHRG